MINVRKLHEAIGSVCPIVSVSIGDASDRTTWLFVPRQEANAEQISLAQEIINSWSVSIFLMEDIRAEARRRILSVFPDWKQSNMIARSVELHRIQAGLMRDANGDLLAPRSLTAEELVEENAINAAWTWIKHIRAKSNEIEAMSPMPADYTDDSYWE